MAPIVYLALTIFVLRERVEYYYLASALLVGTTALGVRALQPKQLKITAYWLLVLAAIGLSAAVILTIEKFELLEDPNRITSCSVSPIVACSPVIGSEQASAFGFANPVFGLFGYTAVFTAGMTILAGATKVHVNWWRTLLAGIVFGVLFSVWLMFQAFVRIDALCLYCMAVWIVSFSLFWLVLAQMIRDKLLHFGVASAFLQSLGFKRL